MASIQSSHERVSFKKSMSDPVRGWSLFGINYRLASCLGGHSIHALFSAIEQQNMG